MLDDVSDFKSIPSATMARLPGLFTADGALVVDPMPVRCDCASSLPLSGASEADSHFCADIRAIDPLWLLEAVQERESFLSGYAAEVPSSIVTDPKLVSGELLAVANALKSWASRWESSPDGVGCFVRGDAFEEFSDEWEDVVAATLTSSLDVRDKSSSITVDLSDVPSFFQSWSPSSDELEQMTKKDVASVLGKYALRDYLSIPRFLGLEPEDDPGEGVFGWKDVDGWPGYYRPLVRASDVLLLYSDLEATDTAVIAFRSGALSGKKTSDVSRTDRDEYLDYYIEHGLSGSISTGLSWKGCPSMIRRLGPGPSVTASSTLSKSTYSPVLSSAFSHLAWQSSGIRVRDSGGLVSKYDLDYESISLQRQPYSCVTKVTSLPESYQLFYHGAGRTSSGVFPTPVSTSTVTIKYEEERKLTGQVEMDLLGDDLSQWGTTMDGRGQAVESAYVLVSSIAVSYEAKGERATYYGAMRTERYDYPDAYGAVADIECKVNIRVKKVACTVRDDRYLTLPSISADDIPDASGGAVIEIEFPYTGADASGSRMEPAVSESKYKGKGSRKAITGIGPVLVKFKPRTLVKE